MGCGSVTGVVPLAPAAVRHRVQALLRPDQVLEFARVLDDVIVDPLHVGYQLVILRESALDFLRGFLFQAG